MARREERSLEELVAVMEPEIAWAATVVILVVQGQVLALVMWPVEKWAELHFEKKKKCF